MKIDISPWQGKRVCIALSGGGDSVALFDYCKAHAAAYNIALSAVHIEHGIRGQTSRSDAAFINKLCAREGVPLFSFAENVPAAAKDGGIGLEEAGRNIRYARFCELLAEDRADVVFTAHHAGDNAESVLFNLFRGASLAGMGGIRAFLPAEELCARFAPAYAAAQYAPALVGKGVARPMLAVTKGEVSAYLAARALEYRTDETNADPAYARNFLRSAVLAPAKERFPACERHIYAFSRLAREDEAFLSSLAESVYERKGEACRISVSAPRSLFLRACARALRALGVEKDFSLADLEAAFSLVSARNGACAHLPRGVCAWREYDAVVLARRQPAAAYEYSAAPGSFDCGAYTVRIEQGAVPQGQGGFPRPLVLDAAKLPPGCVLRPRAAGDIFTKFGGGTKKLKDYLIDKKIPRRLRDLPVLACGHTVYAVCGVEISEQVRLGEAAAAWSIQLYRKGETQQCTPM